MIGNLEAFLKKNIKFLYKGINPIYKIYLGSVLLFPAALGFSLNKGELQTTSYPVSASASGESVATIQKGSLASSGYEVSATGIIDQEATIEKVKLTLSGYATSATGVQNTEVNLSQSSLLVEGKEVSAIVLAVAIKD